MTDELSTEQVEKGVKKRGSDGELLPDEHDVTLPDGSEVVIKTEPLTTGTLNELSHIDEEIANLKPEAIREAFQTAYRTDALTNLSVEEIRDTDAAYLTAYLKPLDDAVGENFDIGDDEGNPAQMSKSERARQMR